MHRVHEFGGARHAQVIALLARFVEHIRAALQMCDKPEREINAVRRFKRNSLLLLTLQYACAHGMHQISGFGSSHNSQRMRQTDGDPSAICAYRRPWSVSSVLRRFSHRGNQRSTLCTVREMQTLSLASSGPVWT